jgi:hypothetical protein
MEALMFRSLGVIVDDGVVYRALGFGGKGTVLGPLAGAEAGVTEGTSRHTLTRVLTVAGALTRKYDATAYVAAGNGVVHQVKLTTAGQIRRAQADAVRFNALARAASHEAERADARPGPFTAEDRAREKARRAAAFMGGESAETGDYPPGDRDAPGYKPDRRYPKP